MINNFINLYNNIIIIAIKNKKYSFKKFANYCQ